ncbi:MAG: alpha/beta fold hydrolase [Desulfobacterales bacterium]
MSDWKLNKKFNFKGHAVRYGFEGSGPALVLVHGTPWSSFNLRHLISGLSDTFTVYYFDLLGYGQSDKPDVDVSLGIQNILLDALLTIPENSTVSLYRQNWVTLNVSKPGTHPSFNHHIL